jgi:hypothetical protein
MTPQRHGKHAAQLREARGHDRCKSGCAHVLDRSIGLEALGVVRGDRLVVVCQPAGRMGANPIRSHSPASAGFSGLSAQFRPHGWRLSGYA